MPYLKFVILCEESSRVCIRKIAELLKGEAILGPMILGVKGVDFLA